MAISDTELADYIDGRAKSHPSGVSGYFTGLALLNREQWVDAEELRRIALAKLTDNERAALGFGKL